MRASCSTAPARCEENLATVNAFLETVLIIPFDDTVADEYGRIRWILHRDQLPIGPLDLQIAATALTHSLIAVTNNVREFVRVPELVVEAWQKA